MFDSRLQNSSVNRVYFHSDSFIVSSPVPLIAAIEM